MKRFKLNTTSLDVCKVIVSSNPIKSITLAQHKVGLNWSQKYPTSRMQKEHLLEAYAVRPMRLHRFSKREFLSESYSRVLRRLKGDEVLSVVSKVRTTSGEEMHIPLINFHPEGAFGLNEIKKALAYACQRKHGALLKSGRFYHYYGDFLLSQREWENFLGMFLIPVHLVHPSYVGHALKYGFNTLRLTPGKAYKSQTPRVTEVL